MRVIVPFTEIHPLTDQALQRWAPQAERVDVSASITSYWELLTKVWADSHSFVVVEHDIEIHEHVLTSFAACPEPWCVYLYLYRGRRFFSQSLGCSRFRDSLLEERPNLIADFQGACRHWNSLDGRLIYELGEIGYRAHAHCPPVTHHDERRLGEGKFAEMVRQELHAFQLGTALR